MHLQVFGVPPSATASVSQAETHFVPEILILSVPHEVTQYFKSVLINSPVPQVALQPEKSDLILSVPEAQVQYPPAFDAHASHPSFLKLI